MRRPATVGVSTPGSGLSPKELRRLRDFAAAVGIEVLEEIAVRDAAMRRLDAVLRSRSAAVLVEDPAAPLRVPNRAGSRAWIDPS